SAAGWCAPGWGAPAPFPRAHGTTPRRRPACPGRVPPSKPVLARRLVTGGGSPATSWCRAPQRNWRCVGSVSCAVGSCSTSRVGPGPHLVYFRHDEVIVHGPAELAEQVAGDVAASLTAAARLVFGHAPVDFPVQVASVENYGDAGHG